MPRFFVEPNNINQNNITINGSDAVHIGRSLRMRLGDEITVCCEGEEYECKILTISDKTVECEILSHRRGDTEPNIKLTLFQALPKSDKMEFIVQKATELGAVRIVPVITERCVSRPDQKSFRKKLERLNKIALEAAKQCGRTVVPTVEPMTDLNGAVHMAAKLDKVLICYEKGGIALNSCGLKSGQSIGLFIGSEGGFEESEVQKCTENAIIAVGLGKRILRCETAPVAAISVIMNLTDNLGN